MELVAKATKRIGKVTALHGEVTKPRITPEQRSIGFVLHSEKIEASLEPYHFTKDWALIELHNEKFDWSTFKGNKIMSVRLLPYLCFHLVFHFSSCSSLVVLSSVLADCYITFFPPQAVTSRLLSLATQCFLSPPIKRTTATPDGLLQVYSRSTSLSRMPRFATPSTSASTVRSACLS